jgi:hypothetical protein
MSTYSVSTWWFHTINSSQQAKNLRSKCHLDKPPGSLFLYLDVFLSGALKRFFPAVRRFAVFRAAESAFFSGNRSFSITTLVEFTGFLGLFQSSPFGSAIFSRVTYLFGPSFSRASFGGSELNDLFRGNSPFRFHDDIDTPGKLLCSRILPLKHLCSPKGPSDFLG